MKRNLLLLVFFILFSSVSLADKTPFGDGFYWEITPEGTLVISGSGEMPSCKALSDKNEAWHTFENRRLIKKAVIQDGITSIGEYAFYFCQEMRYADIPYGVTRIDRGAFVGCKNLDMALLPESVSEIGGIAFWDCENLNFVYLPTNLKIIGGGAFLNCKALTSIDIPSGVKICEYAFRESGLTSVKIPEGVKIIDKAVFYKCESLMSVSIPNSVTTIRTIAFSESALQSVTLPSSLDSISPVAFMDCPKLSIISVATGNKKYDSRGNCNAVIEKGTNKLILGCKTTKIPNTVKTIDAFAFYKCKALTSLNIPNGVTCIDSYAFKGCVGLSYLKIPQSVTEIGTEAFAGCTNLSLEIPPSAIDIEGKAFDGCKAVEAYGGYQNGVSSSSTPTSPSLSNASESSPVPARSTSSSTSTKPGLRYQGWYNQNSQGYNLDNGQYTGFAGPDFEQRVEVYSDSIVVQGTRYEYSGKSGQWKMYSCNMGSFGNYVYFVDQNYNMKLHVVRSNPYTGGSDIFLYTMTKNGTQNAKYFGNQAGQIINSSSSTSTSRSGGSSTGRSSSSSRRTVCSVCHGDGKCNSCHGSGKRTDNQYGTGTNHSRTCGVCGGSGRCRTCNGTGYR